MKSSIRACPEPAVAAATATVARPRAAPRGRYAEGGQRRAAAGAGIPFPPSAQRSGVADGRRVAPRPTCVASSRSRCGRRDTAVRLGRPAPFKRAAAGLARRENPVRRKRHVHHDRIGPERDPRLRALAGVRRAGAPDPRRLLPPGRGIEQGLRGLLGAARPRPADLDEAVHADARRVECPVLQVVRRRAAERFVQLPRPPHLHDAQQDRDHLRGGRRLDHQGQLPGRSTSASASSPTA